jgi:hypothetical protein
MVRPGPRKNMVGIPKVLLSWMKQRSGGPQGNIFTKKIINAPGTGFLGGVSELGPSTRILTTREREREREREGESHDSWHDSMRELTKGGPRKSIGGGRVMGVHWP